MSILAQAIIAALIFAAGAAGGIRLHVGIVAARDLKAVQASDRARIVAQHKGDVASEAHETRKAAVEVRERIVKQEVDRVVEKTVYSNVCLDDDGLRILAADVAQRNPGREPAPGLPRAADPPPAGRPQPVAVEP